MPRVSEEERKKQQERGKAYVGVTGQQLANINQLDQQQQQSQTVTTRQRQRRPQEQVLPPVDQWDYQTSPIGPHGEDLPAGSQGWKPDGKPFFGDGLTGKLKEYWWNFSKDIPGTASVEEMTNLWNQSKNLIKQNKNVPYWQQDNQYAKQFRENIVEALGGKGTPLTDEQKTRQKELVVKRQAGNALSTQEQQELNELSRGAIDESALSGARRLVNVGVTAGLQLLNVTSEKVEQTLGAVRGGAEELAKQAGTEVPGQEAAQQVQQRKDDYQRLVKSGEINPHAQPPSISWQEASTNLRSNLVTSPLGIAYNAIKLVLSPTGGDWDAVKNAIDKGWDSGRILYTQVYDPMKRYEYEQRLDQGENPELLAIELGNPWAEMVGQVILDPLNLIGVAIKGAKVAGKLDEATDAVRPMLTLLDSSMEDSVKLFQEATTNEGARRAVQEVADSYVKKTLERAEVRAQKYGWNQLTSTSQKNLMKRDMANFFGNTIGGLVLDGRQVDDIADIMKYGVMSVSENSDEALEGIAGLMNANVPKQFFSELGNDSLSTVRRMLVNAEGELDPQKIFRALASDNPIESMMKITDEAATQRFASVAEMEKAYDVVQTGKYTEKQLKLAKAYEAVPQHIKNFTKIVEPAEKAKGVVNSGLGFFYFTVNPGTAVRNKISNTMFSLWDNGPAAFFDNGVFKTQADVEAGLTKHLGRKYEVGATFGSQAGKAPNLMAKFEAADALRVIETRYMDAFGRLMETALPYDDVLKQAGMTNSKFRFFKELVKREGNLNDALTAFNKMQGLADWRALDWLNPTQVRGLKQSGNVWNDIVDLATNPNISVEDVTKFIDAKLGSYADNAARAVDDVPGFSHLWKSSEEAAKYIGRAVEEGHISNADYTKLGQIQEASEQAIEAYKLTLREQIALVPDPNVRAGLFQKLSDMLMQSEAGGKEVRRVVDGMWEKIYKTKKDIRGGNLSVMDAAWKEFGFEGVAPKQAQQYIDEMFSNGRMKRSTLWEEHFSIAIGQSEELIGDLSAAGQDTNDLTNLFRRARDLDAQAQEFRSAVYLNNGKAYVGAPPKGTKLGQMDYDSTKRFLQELGWERGQTEGVMKAVNKDRRAKGLAEYEKWQDVTWQDAVESVKARTQGEYEELSSRLVSVSVSPTIEKFKKVDNLGGVWGREHLIKNGFTDSEVDSLISKGFLETGTYGDTETLRMSDDLIKQVQELKKSPLSEQEVSNIQQRMRQIDELARPTGSRAIPVHPAGADASVPRQFLETQKGFNETLEYMRSYITEHWGEIGKTDDLAVSQALAEYIPKYSNRITDSKAIAIKNAEYWRDFTLLGYDTGKKYGNLAAAYPMPYAFWYSGTYRNVMERLVTDPQVIAGYAKYKQAVEEQNRFAPDWYRQQVKIDNVFGMELENPLFFNLEATLNPLNGLTGPDFMDKSKRVNWWTSTLDDMGKFGPSIWAPIQIATAVSFMAQNDQETALRWAGRLAPQTPAIKAISSLVFGKPIETDPNVLLFGGGKTPFDFFGAMDSYERGRVARALGDVQQREIDAIMANTGMSSAEKQMAIAELEAKYTEVAYTQEGPEWQEAYRLATNLRAPGQITSPLLGVGFKARTQVDIEIDEMYGQMGQLFAMRDGMSAEDYQKGWEQLRERYPYIDTVLLARKGGDLRDSAYAYNIIARVPPGRTDDVFRELKIDDLRQQFYDNKGDMSKWSEQDKSRFMDAVVDIGAIMAIPPDATKQEWREVKNASADMYEYLKSIYGEDIIDKSQIYYSKRDKNYQDGRLYLEAHPEINDYLNDKSNIVTQNPLLFKYYGSLQTVENYYQSKLREELSQKYGKDIYDLAAEYNSLPESYTDQRKQWRDANPEMSEQLFAYYDALDKVKQDMKKKFGSDIVDLASQYSEIPKEQRSKWKKNHPKQTKRLNAYWDVYYPAKDKVVAQYGGDRLLAIEELYSSLPKETDNPRKQWQVEHPDEFKRLTGFWEDKNNDQTQRNINDATVRLYDRLPEAPEPLLRGEPGTAVQQTIAEQAARPQVSAQELVAEMPGALVELLDMYFQGEDLPQPAIDELERIGNRYGLSVNDVLLALQVGQ